MPAGRYRCCPPVGTSRPDRDAFIVPAWNVVIGTTRLRLTPDALLGRVASAGSILAMGALPLGSGGLLLQSIGAVGASAVLSSGMLLLAVAGTVSPSVRHAPELAGLGKESQRHDDSGASWAHRSP